MSHCNSTNTFLEKQDLQNMASYQFRLPSIPELQHSKEKVSDIGIRNLFDPKQDVNTGNSLNATSSIIPTTPNIVHPHLSVTNLYPRNLNCSSISNVPIVNPDIQSTLKNDKSKLSLVDIDHSQVPCIVRNGIEFISVRVAEVKFLYQFPKSYPEDVTKDPPLISLPIFKEESQMLDQFNTTRQYEFGIESFESDFIVTLHEFIKFYRKLKGYFVMGESQQDFSKRSDDKDFIVNSTGSENNAVTMQEDNDRDKQMLSKVQQFNLNPLNAIASTDCITGGWLQVNNIVVPYVNRDDIYVPVEIVMLAFPDIDYENIAVKASYKECTFLNHSCRCAGVEYKFSEEVQICSVKQIKFLCNSTVILKELPTDLPFSEATFEHIDEQRKVADFKTHETLSQRTSNTNKSHSLYDQTHPFYRTMKSTSEILVEQYHPCEMFLLASAPQDQTLPNMRSQDCVSTSPYTSASVIKMQDCVNSLQQSPIQNSINLIHQNSYLKKLSAGNQKNYLIDQTKEKHPLSHLRDRLQNNSRLPYPWLMNPTTILKENLAFQQPLPSIRSILSKRVTSPVQMSLVQNQQAALTQSIPSKSVNQLVTPSPQFINNFSSLVNHPAIQHEQSPIVIMPQCTNTGTSSFHPSSVSSHISNQQSPAVIPNSGNSVRQLLPLSFSSSTYPPGLVEAKGFQSDKPVDPNHLQQQLAIQSNGISCSFAGDVSHDSDRNTSCSVSQNYHSFLRPHMVHSNIAIEHIYSENNNKGSSNLPKRLPRMKANVKRLTKEKIFKKIMQDAIKATVQSKENSQEKRCMNNPDTSVPIKKPQCRQQQRKGVQKQRVVEAAMYGNVMDGVETDHICKSKSTINKKKSYFETENKNNSVMEKCSTLKSTSSLKICKQKKNQIQKCLKQSMNQLFPRNKNNAIGSTDMHIPKTFSYQEKGLAVGCSNNTQNAVNILRIAYDVEKYKNENNEIVVHPQKHLSDTKNDRADPKVSREDIKSKVLLRDVLESLIKKSFHPVSGNGETNLSVDKSMNVQDESMYVSKQLMNYHKATKQKISDVFMTKNNVVIESSPNQLINECVETNNPSVELEQTKEKFGNRSSVNTCSFSRKAIAGSKDHKSECIKRRDICNKAAGEECEDKMTNSIFTTTNQTPTEIDTDPQINVTIGTKELALTYEGCCDTETPPITTNDIVCKSDTKVHNALETQNAENKSEEVSDKNDSCLLENGHCDVVEPVDICERVKISCSNIQTKSVVTDEKHFDFKKYCNVIKAKEIVPQVPAVIEPNTLSLINGPINNTKVKNKSFVCKENNSIECKEVENESVFSRQIENKAADSKEIEKEFDDKKEVENEYNPVEKCSDINELKDSCQVTADYGSTIKGSGSLDKVITENFSVNNNADPNELVICNKTKEKCFGAEVTIPLNQVIPESKETSTTGSEFIDFRTIGRRNFISNEMEHAVKSVVVSFIPNENHNHKNVYTILAERKCNQDDSIQDQSKEDISEKKQTKQIACLKLMRKPIYCIRRKKTGLYGPICVIAEMYPMVPFDQFLNILLNILVFDIVECSKQEEKCISEVLGRPLHCNQFVNISMFRRYLPQIKLLCDQCIDHGYEAKDNWKAYRDKNSGIYRKRKEKCSVIVSSVYQKRCSQSLKFAKVLKVVLCDIKRKKSCVQFKCKYC